MEGLKQGLLLLGCGNETAVVDDEVGDVFF
jgi:hypothetical protein